MRLPARQVAVIVVLVDDHDIEGVASITGQPLRRPA